MKLLFDENLSPRLVELLKTRYPGSTHIRNVDLKGATDERIWVFARTEDFTIVSKDTDFRERSLVDGFPPKVVWLAVGNAATVAIADVLQCEHQRVTRFIDDQEASLLVLSLDELTI